MNRNVDATYFISVHFSFSAGRTEGSEGRRRVAVFFLLISVFFYPIMVNKDEYNT